MITLTSLARTQFASPSFKTKCVATWLPICTNVGYTRVAARAGLCSCFRATSAEVEGDNTVVAARLCSRQRTNMDARSPAILEQTPPRACSSPRIPIAWREGAESVRRWCHRERLKERLLFYRFYVDVAISDLQDIILQLLQTPPAYFLCPCASSGKYLAFQRSLRLPKIIILSA